MGPFFKKNDDLPIAESRAKQCEIEDRLMGLEIHDMMVSLMHKLNKSSPPANNVGGCMTHQNNKETIDFFLMDVPTDQTAAIQTLMQWMGNKVHPCWQCVQVLLTSLHALANALAKAPSTWALGNAGMGALQRLEEDRSLTIAATASRTIYALNKQWEMEEGYTRGKTKQQRVTAKKIPTENT